MYRKSSTPVLQQMCQQVVAAIALEYVVRTTNSRQKNSLRILVYHSRGSKKQHGRHADSLGGDDLVVCAPDEKHWALIPAQSEQKVPGPSASALRERNSERDNISSTGELKAFSCWSNHCCSAGGGEPPLHYVRVTQVSYIGEREPREQIELRCLSRALRAKVNYGN